MKKFTIAFSFLLILAFSSCEYLNLEDDNGELSTAEIIEGLKAALEVGTDSSATVLSALNGYYGDELVKIPLPEEAQVVRQLISNNSIAQFFDLDSQFENVIQSVNRAAESAAKDAGPIFGDAISDLSISQGWDILNGVVPSESGVKSSAFDSTAATKFFQNQTSGALTILYAPKINEALGEDLGLGFSAVTAWSTLTNSYNTTLNSTAVQIALTGLQFTGNGIDLPPEIETDLGVFSTEKALDGLFLKVGEQEKKIRRNPFEWAVDIIQRVFGFIQDNI